MKIINVNEASGAALDWLVAKCEGLEFDEESQPIWFESDGFLAPRVCYAPTIDWSHGGPIIEQNLITVCPRFFAGRTESGSDYYRQDGWTAYISPPAFWVTPRPQVGPTPLIAAMRCYVTSRLGAATEVPDELV